MLYTEQELVECFFVVENVLFLEMSPLKFKISSIIIREIVLQYKQFKKCLPKMFFYFKKVYFNNSKSDFRRHGEGG